MKVSDAAPALIGDVARFGDLTDRVEGLIESQVSRFRSGAEEWIVLPWENGFYLFSENSEGQRQGREVTQAFLGPSIALIETVSDEHLASNLPAEWRATGLVRASFLRRVAPNPHGSREMLSRLEDLVASVGGRATPTLEFKRSRSDLLRDFRLALINLDDDSARSLLEQIKLTGSVSAENARYLKIEYLAAFGRWAEMRAMPHIETLLKARRPKAVSETLLRMVWWSELAGPGLGAPAQALRELVVVDTYGALLRSVRLPSTAEGRGVAFLAAAAAGDEEWQSELLAKASSQTERASLEALAPMIAAPSSTEPTGREASDQHPIDPVVELFRAGKFAEVVRAFVLNPDPEHAKIALEAILDSGDTGEGDVVARLVREFAAQGQIELSRRGRRDLDELVQALAGACTGWLEWATRLGGGDRWADGATTIRNGHEQWEPLTSIGAQSLAEVCDALLEASGGPNVDQLRICLDILCIEAASILNQGEPNDFCQVVLALLSEQENFSEMVRNAYLGLLAAWLAAGPAANEYDEVLDQTLAIWNRIASPNAADWANSVLEAMVDAPCPDEPKRTSTAVLMIDGLRQRANRLTLRQQVEVEGLAADFGLPTREIDAPQDELDVWAKLDGKSVGIYSLLARAEMYLKERLSRLCSVGEVKGNSDLVATQALRSLAERADYLVVDTWHAAHQATGAIDAVRPRERQILPKLRGHSGFLRALEDALAG
jgi:hypothetical protein